MSNFLKYILYALFLSVAVTFFSSCEEEEEWMSLPNGKVSFAIGQVTTETGTRATPSELGKPLADKFNLKVQRRQNDYLAYEGKFVESLEVKIGDYDITASCGQNVIIGRDAPYYIGTAQATIREDQSENVVIPCRVGNALVSVRFGKDAAEQERFSQFYDDYGLLVKNGDYSMSIGKDETHSSIYFPAGTSPELVFYGTLKQDGGRTVSTTLTHQSLPTVFNAADHAILTLSLSDPVSAISVSISKVELVESTLDETIPLSWLPVPKITARHNYNSNGMLMGTDLTFSNTYPEMTWEARVSNAQGDTVRRVTGTGELSSGYVASEEWPYLQAGKYKATYFLHTDDGVTKVSSREFSVGKPEISLSLGGYTSYDKYVVGDIEAANSSDGFTLYNPQVSVNISPALVKISKYGYLLTYDFNGSEQTSSSNSVLLENMVLAAQLNTYLLSANVQFAGESASAQRDFRITGIPFCFEPPTTSTWQKSGDVTDEDGYVRMGRWNGGSQSITYTQVALPAGIRLALDYKFKPNSGLITTTLTIYAGDQELVSGKANSYENPTYEGVKEFTTSASATNVRCYNSYGAGNTGTDVYRVAMKYRQ